MKVKIITIISILVFHVVFVNLTMIDFYNKIIGIFMIILLLFLIKKMPKYFKENFKLNIILILFSISMTVSSYLNDSNNQIVFLGKVFIIFLFMEYVKSINEEKRCYKVFFYLSLFYCILNDVFMFLKPPVVIGYNEYYLIGNKFGIPFFHMIVLTMYLLLKDISLVERKNLIGGFELMWFAFSLFITLYLKCTTLLIGYVIYFLFIVFQKIIEKKIYIPKFFLIIVIISSLLLIVFSEILMNNYIASFIVNVLHKDITLTGRMNIYGKIFPVLNEKIIFGYGYGNSYDILMDKMSAPNTQNGILECIFNYGIVGTMLMLTLFYKIMKSLFYDCENKKYYSIVVNIYIYIILGCVEITYGLPLFALFAMINQKENNV